MPGCRDCDACTKPALWRLMRGLMVTWWLVMFKVVRSTCPQCGHTLGRHRRRADRSFAD